MLVVVSREYKTIDGALNAMKAAELLKVPYLIEKSYYTEKRSSTVLRAVWRIDIFSEPEDERDLKHFDE